MCKLLTDVPIEKLGSTMIDCIESFKFENWKRF